ncbi:DinB family protein [Kineosporia babensis]|uniref:DinB family protein n=1 Tax=Kineosporia babensis TaxID=499548 RepID=A0A9X1NCT3_9ACTN|nr:DinB family protein [Kineosporia babensis]MCD5312842.1 DinB family protein [Kineosporia babensis]
MDWTKTLLFQWEFHWDNQLRARLQGLSDEEYRWEPVPDAWNVRPRGSNPVEFGTGDFVIDYAFPTPEPEPFTTIAWRLGHVIVGVLAMRNATHFGAPEAAYDTWEYPGDAKTALQQLEAQLALWVAGVGQLSAEELSTPVGSKEPAFPELSMADLVLHIHRELIHHLSEVCLLRDLYLHIHRSEGAH